jgi:hypothetical protein
MGKFYATFLAQHSCMVEFQEAIILVISANKSASLLQKLLLCFIKLSLFAFLGALTVKHFSLLYFLQLANNSLQTSIMNRLFTIIGLGNKKINYENRFIFLSVPTACNACKHSGNYISAA